MNETRGKTSWIVPPAEVCILCHKPINSKEEKSAWNDHPAHAECVRIHTLQRHPVFRDWSADGEEAPEEPEEGGNRTDDDEDEGWPG